MTQIRANDEVWMQAAIDAAKQALLHNEVPIGAVLVQDERIIGIGFNQVIMNHDPCAHAEIIAIRQAGQYLGNYRLLDTTMYTTLEPCSMCMSAIKHARIKRLVYGAYDTRPSGSAPDNHTLELSTGLMATECTQLLQDFFKLKRNSK